MVYLYKQGFGGCMADDMGLGKTIQTISLLLYIQSEQKEKQPVEATENEIHEPELPAQGQLTIFDQPTLPNTPAAQGANTLPSLVVVPTSLVYNWVNELKRFAPSLMYYVHTGNKRLKNQHSVFRMFDVVITTYGTLRKDINLLQKCKFHHLVLDESQYIKNPASDTHKAVKQINALHKLALTGTPIENSLIDLWSIFDLLNPGMLGSLSAFRERYANNTRLLEDKLAEERLLTLINPFILRRTKEQAAPELPPLQEETVYCNMSTDQQQYYEEEKSKLRNRLTDVQLTDRKQTAFVALQGLTKLRLLANHPALTDNEYKGESGKFEEIISRIRTLRDEGHKVLVFSSFVKHLRLLSDYFELQGWDYAWLTGATDPDERQRQINKFMNVASAGCFFVSLKAGGVGLNLTVADYVFILDPWWNPAAEMQALSRTHRIGQQRKVMAYRFITTDSIEEKIRRLQETKSQLADTFINNPHPLAQMNGEEISELIG
jgi:SNF2 family DNA or RNA helicase